MASSVCGKANGYKSILVYILGFKKKMCVKGEVKEADFADEEL